MNEIHGMAPNACQTVNELRSILLSFGPHTGRYLVSCPDLNAWRKLVIGYFENSRELDKKRLAEMLHPFNSRCTSGFIEAQSLLSRHIGTWDKSRSWIDNVIPVWRDHPELSLLFVNEDEQIQKTTTDPSLAKFLSTPGEINPPLSSDIAFQTAPDTYWNISKIVCLLSTEIHIIDPFFNPSRNDRKAIFRKFIEELSQIRKVRSIHFWVRAKEVMDYIDRIGYEIKSAGSTFFKGLRQPPVLHYHAINDQDCRDKLHARLLITDKGGIKFDQGFQILRHEVKNLASTVNESYRNEIFQKFSHKDYDFEVEKTITFAIPTLR